MSDFSKLKTVAGRVRLQLSRKPRIAYIGGGNRNLGDSCMYEAAAELFPGLVPYTAPGSESKLARLGLSGRRFFRGCLLGGGTLINNYSLTTIQEAVGQGLPLAAIGTGAGIGGFDMSPVADMANWSELFKSFFAIGVRGPKSLDLLRGVGVENARVVGDLAFLYARSVIRPIHADASKFGINAISPHGHAQYGKDELRALADAAKELVARGWQPVPLACAPDDAKVLAELLRHALREDVPIHLPKTAGEFIDRVADCTVMISMRLHGSALAACAGVPPVVVSYLGKCEDLAASLQLERFVVPVQELRPGRILDCVESIQTGGSELRRQVLSRAQQWRKELTVLCDEIRRRMLGESDSLSGKDVRPSQSWVGQDHHTNGHGTAKPSNAPIRHITSALGNNSWVIRQLGPIRERLLDRSYGKRGLIRTVNGLPIRVVPRYRWYFARDYDSHVANFFRQRVRPGAVCVNAGANLGIYALQFANWSGSTGAVYAFEPNPSSAQILRQHVRMNRVTSRVRVVEQALADRPGTAAFYAAGVDGMSRLGQPNPQVVGQVSVVNVEVNTLDRFCGEHGIHPDVLMIDIEGFEIAALEGAAALFRGRRPPPVTVVELHPNAWSVVDRNRSDLERLLADYRLRPIPLSGQNDCLGEYGHVWLEPI